MEFPTLSEAVQQIYEGGGWLWTLFGNPEEVGCDELLEDFPQAKEVPLESDQMVGLWQAEIAGLVQTEYHRLLCESGDEIVVATHHLTTDGFSIAHDRELTEQRQKTNKNLAFFTLVLAAAAVIQGSAAAVQVEIRSIAFTLLLGNLGVAIFVVLYNFRKRLMGIRRTLQRFLEQFRWKFRRSNGD